MRSSARRRPIAARRSSALAAAAAMASNGKVAVDKLKIGATVSIKLKDSGSCEGAVYTVDPVTKTVVLFSAAEKPVTQDSRDVRLVPEHAIDSIKVVKPPDAKDKKALVAPLPAIDVAACKKRESEAYEAMEAAMAMLNPNASAADRPPVRRTTNGTQPRKQRRGQGSLQRRREARAAARAAVASGSQLSAG